jgi:hypothetical protein
MGCSAAVQPDGRGAMSFAAIANSGILPLAAALTVIAVLCWALYPGTGGVPDELDVPESAPPIPPGQSTADAMPGPRVAARWQVRRAEVLAQLGSSRRGAFAALSWEWVLRANGQVAYRLAKVDGRAERNPWMPVTQLAPTELHWLRQDRSGAAALLADLARQHGHEADRPHH